VSLEARSLSHYRILERLDEGGQGVVYRAYDERLEREVAIKVLPAGALADEATRKRFRKEALSLSKLNHPNIATVFDFDSDQGIDFLVMELVPGLTLSTRIAGRALAEREVARLGEQIAEGLAAAHKAGILHRDIKPGNLRLTSEGRIKILDFGLAKLVPVADGTGTQTITTTEEVAGTIPYMSPEQLRGERVDERSDVYALGAVLYEMATGGRPFPQRTHGALIGAILNEAPPAAQDLAPTVSSELQRIILKCLEKDAEDRYQAARELAVDLRHLVAPSAVRRAKPKQKRRSAVPVAIAGATLVALAGGLVLWKVIGLQFGRGGTGQAWGHSLAVLPLANLSGDPNQEFFADGMTDEIITRLSQVGALRVIARSSVMQYKGSKKPLRQIARELDVAQVLEGSVVRAGDMVRISAQLVEPASQHNLWAESYERSLSNVLVLQSEVARAIVERIRVQLTPAERTRLASAPAVNPHAHEEYLKGEFELNRFTTESFQRARDHFQRAIEIDPEYAAAHAGLAWSFTNMSSLLLPPREAMPRARAEAQAALQLDSTSVEAITAIGYVTGFYDWNWEKSEVDLKEAVRLYPGSVQAHQLYGYYLTCNGRFEGAMHEFGTAHRLDPLQGYAQAQLIWPLYEGRQYGRAIEEGKKLLRANPRQWDVSMIIGQSYARLGDVESAVEYFKRAVSLDEGPWTLSWLSYGYAVAGQRELARATLARVEELSHRSFVSGYELAVAHMALGEKDEAFRLLERAVQDRAESMVFIKVDPAFDPLRSDPRFKSILHQVGFGT
jgi:eukaryotic-like serine/threonine-protein kinase